MSLRRHSLPSKVMLLNNQTARNVYCGCNNNTIFSDSYFRVSYRRRMPATLIWPQQSIGGSCQSSEMATLLNSLSAVFKHNNPAILHNLMRLLNIYSCTHELQKWVTKSDLEIKIWREICILIFYSQLV